MMALRLAKVSLLVLIAAILIFPLRPAFTSQSQAPAPAVADMATARYCVLYDFGTRPGDPILQSSPAAIADGEDGYLYSTSSAGGTHGYGTVFKVSTVDGKPPIVLYNFDGLHGSVPQGGLTRGSDGSFYGTTYAGGKYNVGTVFKITADGHLTTLWDFRNGKVDPPPVGRPPTEKEKLDAAAAYPISPPVEVGGTFYGVATYAAGFQFGVLYEIGRGGAYKGIYQFKPAEAAQNGAFPLSLSVGPGGSIWGVTRAGGLGWGTIFQVTGNGVSALYKFTADTLGSMGVIQAEDGSLYGTASGPNSRQGVVYKLNPLTKQFTKIYLFSTTDGTGPEAVPVAELTQGSDGMLYGVTKAGGEVGRGSIFRLNTDGTNFTSIFSMDLNDGRYAISPLIEYAPENFYGITYQGGTQDSGVFFHIDIHPYPRLVKPHVTFYQGGVLAAADMTAIIKKDVDAYQIDDKGTAGLITLREPDHTHGILLTLACLRDPHVVQFVYRRQIDRDGTPAKGTYNTSWGAIPPQFTDNPANPHWHTDATGYPNAYYDQAPGASHVTKTSYVNILDAPQPGTENASWQVTAKDFCICNCQVVRVVNWTRGGRYDAATGKLGPGQYVNVNIEAPPASDTNNSWSDQQMQWINNQLIKDGYDVILDR
jgi:uncharacterized repeat protein (TIGR03803 family)